MSHKLLLADDSVTIQRVIELTFADEDIEVSAVGDGQQAIERIRADRPDIVLADVGMPGRDGFEVAAFVKQNPEFRHIPVVLLTGAFEPVDESRVRSVGCDGVLAKPFEPQLLIAKVKQLLAAPAASRTAPAPEPAAAPRPDETALDEIPLQIPSTPDFGTELEVTHLASEPESRVSLDEYFDRLDQAFASRGLAGPPAAPPSREPWPAGEQAAPEWPKPSPIVSEAGPPAEPPAPPAAARQPGAEAPSDLAAAFALLLAAEQGDAVPAGALPLPAGAHTAALDAVVDEVTRRVIQRVADTTVRTQVADVVSQVAERLVRAEIERLKRLA
jgi:CheY-like chemotaxis protein